MINTPISTSISKKADHMNTMQHDASGPSGRRFSALFAPSVAAILLGLASLTGCGGGEEEGSAPAPASGGIAAAPTPSSSGADGASGVDASADAPAGAPSRETVDGTLSLFITAMEDGEFEQAIEMVDATTDLHGELLNIIEAVQTGSSIDDPNAGNIGNMIRLSFALTFAGADYEVVSEDDSRARAVVTLPGANGDQRPVDLNRVDGTWFIVAGRGLISAGGTPPPIPARPNR